MPTLLFLTVLNFFLRYWLKGSKKGTHEVFLDNLPGFPDNLSPYKNGGFVVNLLCSREAPDVIGSIAPFPNVRKFIARSIALVHLAVQKAHSVYPSDMLKKASHLVSYSVFPEKSLGGILPRE